ncbi:type I restriction enzyme protein [Fibrobacteres bacterium R8-0-B4]
MSKEYIDGNVAWDNIIPSHWKLYRFRQLFTIDRGINITKADLQDDGIPCVTYGDIHSRYGFELRPEIHAIRCVDNEYAIANPRSMLYKGDFVFADTSEDVVGSGNFTYLNSTKPTIAGYHTIIVRPRTNESSRFLAYVFDSISFRAQINSKVYGVKVFSITQAILKDTRIPFPPMDEQIAIVSYLDHRTAKIDSLLSDLQRQSELLDRYKRQIIAAAVTKGLDRSVAMKDSGIDWIGMIPATWEIRRIKELIISHQGGAWGEEAQKNENDRICIRVADFDFGRLTIRNDNYTIRNYTSMQIKKLTLAPGDILIEKSGGGEKSPVGRVVMFSKNMSALYANFLEAIHPSKEVNSRFLGYVMALAYYCGVNRKYYNQTTGIQNLDIPGYICEKIGLPPLLDQIAIADFLDEKTVRIDDLISDIATQQAKLKQYRQIIIQEAVTSKIKINTQINTNNNAKTKTKVSTHKESE